MPPQLSDDEIDDLIYCSRAGEDKELVEMLTRLAEREQSSPAEILTVCRDAGKSTCLHMATGNGHLATVEQILAQFSSCPEGAKQTFLDAQNEYGNTGLHWAALGGHIDVVKRLVESGASPAIANDRNYIPLDLAGLNDRVAVVDFFLSQFNEIEGANDAGLLGAVTDVKLTGGEDDADEEGEAGSEEKVF